MIPSFDDGHVLPPFLAGDAVGPARSPYPSTITALVQRFATSPERVSILRGLLRFRSELREAGFTTGLQWIDGSFVENCEVGQQRPPNDVDVVSLVRRPIGCEGDAEWEAFIESNGHLFDHRRVKAELRCDAYFIDLDVDPVVLAQQTTYWFGLFSHQRTTFRWKGMVQLHLLCEDDAANALLDGEEGQW